MKQSKYSRRLFLAAVIIAGLGIGAVGIGTTMAAQSHLSAGASGLVVAIAEKFNLKVADVQAVFDEQHQQMENNRETKEAERLSQAITNGKITQEQANAITAKKDEIKNSMENWSSLDENARREAMKTQREELKQWAKENNIPMFFLQPNSHGGMPGRGFDHEFNTNDGPKKIK